MAIDPKAIAKAFDRLRSAETAAAELPNCKDRKAFVDTWHHFLTSAKGIYTVLEQGAKTTPEDRQWFGVKNSERRKDDLLQYLYQARDASEHGLEEIHQDIPGGLAIGVVKPGYSNNVDGGSFYLDGEGKFHIIEPPKSLDGKPILIEHWGPRFALMPVVGRGPVTYHVPITHLGKPLSSVDPASLAQLGLAWLASLIREAAQRA